MSMTSRERMFAALKGEPVDRAPVFSANQTGTYAHGRNRRRVARSPHEGRAHGQAGRRRVPPCSALTRSACPTARRSKSEALGSTVKYAGREGIPRIDVHAYHLDDTHHHSRRLPFPGPHPRGPKAVSLLKQEFGDDVAVMGNVVGPFSWWPTSSASPTSSRPASRRRTSSSLPRRRREAGTALGKPWSTPGADIIVIEDMMASIDVISPPIYDPSASPTRRSRWTTSPRCPPSCTSAASSTPSSARCADTGVTAISVEPTVDARPLSSRSGHDRPIPLDRRGGRRHHALQRHAGRRDAATWRRPWPTATP